MLRPSPRPLALAALLLGGACVGTLERPEVDGAPRRDLAPPDATVDAPAVDAPPALSDGAPADLSAADGPPLDLAAGGPDLAIPVCATKGPRECNPGPGSGDFCYELKVGTWAGPANLAIEKVLREHPEYFDFNRGFPCCPVAVQPDRYVLAVVANLQAAGLCAIRDPNDGNEIVIKLKNDCAENYGVITSMQVVRHPPRYQSTCIPAWF